ncbi:MAG: molecular chaperone DnaJ [Actinomycetota bacterium]
MAVDYYQMLGVSRDASQEEIKRAFRALARKWHPDANSEDPAAEERFRQVAEAYEVLSDPERRRRYDQGDTIDIGDLFGGGFGGLDDILRSVFGDSGPFGDPFSFGGGRTRTRPRGRDVLTQVEVSLRDAAFGTETEVAFRSDQACPACEGEGAAPGTSRITCSTCGGAGQVRAARRSCLGTMMTVSACPDCGGVGTTVDEPCPDCRGAGVVAGERSVTVEIPPGVSTGTRLRLTGRGESAGPGAATGDLFVEVVVADDERFRREGDDLVHHVTVGVAEAALGTRVDVPLLDGGSESVDIPPGTQPGWVKRLPGEGMGRLGRRGRGDLVVVADVVVPVDLSTEEEDLLRQYARLRGESLKEAGRRRRARR